MEMQLSDVGDIRKITLTGRMDSDGVEVIETRFSAALVPVGKSAVVDLSGVPFLASLGIRMFISTTRALSWKGAKLAIYGATPAVMEIIESMGMGDVVAVTTSESEAIALVSA